MIKIDDLKEIRNQNGVYLYRIKYKNKDLVIKYFEKDEFRREIKYYEILKKSKYTYNRSNGIYGKYFINRRFG